MINTSERFGNLDFIYIMIFEVEIEMWCIIIYLLYLVLNDFIVYELYYVWC